MTIVRVLAFVAKGGVRVVMVSFQRHRNAHPNALHFPKCVAFRGEVDWLGVRKVQGIFQMPRTGWVIAH